MGYRKSRQAKSVPRSMKNSQACEILNKILKKKWVNNKKKAKVDKFDQLVDHPTPEYMPCSGSISSTKTKIKTKFSSCNMILVNVDFSEQKSVRHEKRSRNHTINLYFVYQKDREK